MTEQAERAEKIRRGRLLLKLHETLIRIKTEDEVDRVYFRSTNDADAFKDIVSQIDDFNFERILAEKNEPDIFEKCRTANQEKDRLAALLAAADMTPFAFGNAIKTLERKIGAKAEISTFLTSEGRLYAAVYATGNFSNGKEFSVEADRFDDLLSAVTAKWTEYEAAHRARTIRKMALAIIRITAERGECTDAALRNCGEFDPGQVRAYGDAACADANEIAGKGPFMIIVNGGANVEAA